MKKNSRYNPAIHHRRSIRLKGYDYAQAGLYFITICCKYKICHFGQVKNGSMVLNKYGQIAHDEWLKTVELRPNIELGPFVIMPNHMHGIIRIVYKEEGARVQARPVTTGDSVDAEGKRESNESGVPLRGPSQTIGAVVRGYKGSVTRQVRLLGFTGELWLRNYHERIIRTKRAHFYISRYILNNPAKWEAVRKTRRKGGA